MYDVYFKIMFGYLHTPNGKPTMIMLQFLTIDLTIDSNRPLAKLAHSKSSVIVLDYTALL